MRDRTPDLSTTAILPAPTRRRPDCEAAALVLLPIAAALPLILTGGGTAAAAMYAELAAQAGWLKGALILPERLARDVGLFLLAVHLALQVSAGFATRRLLVRIGLDRAAAAGALFFVFTPPLLPGAAGDGAALGASVALLLLATERCLAPRFPGEGGALALAAAVIALGMFGDPTQLEEGGGLALLWSLGRLSTPLPQTRVRATARLLTGAAFGLLVAVPLNAALNSVAGAVGLSQAESAAQSFGAWLGWLTPPPTWDLRPLAMAAAPTLPLLAAAALGVGARRGWPIRAALGVAALLAAILSTWRAQAAGENAGPVLFLAVGVLAAIAIRDAEQGRPASLRLRIGVALGTIAAATAIAWLLPGREIRLVAVGEAAVALLALTVVRRPATLWLTVLAGVLAGYETPLVASIFPM